MEWLTNLIAEHGVWIGYTILFLGSCVEGESVVLFISALSYYGHLHLPYVMLTAFTATLLADQISFHIGKHYGPGLIKRHPSLQAPSEKVFYYLHKYNTLFIMSFRFVYGIRIAGPIVIGTSGISTLRFTLLNVPAAAVWAVLSCTAGYYLAPIIETVVKRLSSTGKIIALSLLGTFLIIYVGRKIYYAFNKKEDT
jgi:membrane protein DedA with SNARE-associated domain